MPPDITMQFSELNFTAAMSSLIPLVVGGIIWVIVRVTKLESKSEAMQEAHQLDQKALEDHKVSHEKNQRDLWNTIDELRKSQDDFKNTISKQLYDINTNVTRTTTILEMQHGLNPVMQPKTQS